MPVLTDPGDFANDTLADAEEVNERFAPLYTALNGELDEANHAVPKGTLSVFLAADTAFLTTAGIVFSSEEFDVSGWHATATGLFTPTVPGYYAVGWAVSAGEILTADTFWGSSLIRNGLVHKLGSYGFQRGATAYPLSVGSAIVLATGTTTIGVVVDHGKGSPATVRGGAPYTYMHAALIGRS